MLVSGKGVVEAPGGHGNTNVFQQMKRPANMAGLFLVSLLFGCCGEVSSNNR